MIISSNFKLFDCEAQSKLHLTPSVVCLVLAALHLGQDALGALPLGLGVLHLVYRYFGTSRCPNFKILTSNFYSSSIVNMIICPFHLMQEDLNFVLYHFIEFL